MRLKTGKKFNWEKIKIKIKIGDVERGFYSNKRREVRVFATHRRVEGKARATSQARFRSPLKRLTEKLDFEGNDLSMTRCSVAEGTTSFFKAPVSFLRY